MDTKTVDSSTVTQVVTSDEDGLSSVTVNPYVINNQDKELKVSGYYHDLDSSITADAGYDGLNSVKIDAPHKGYLVVQAFGKGGYTMNVNRYIPKIDVRDLSLQSKTLSSWGPGADSSILPDDGYDGFTDIKILSQFSALRVKPLAAELIWNSSLNRYTIPLYESIVPKKNVTSILLDYVLLQSNKTVDASTVSQTVTFDEWDSDLLNAYDASADPDNLIIRYQGLKQVTVNPYTVESKSDTLTANGHYTYTPTGADALSEVTIDVSINTAPTLQSKTVNSSTSSQIVHADQNYDGLSQVVVNPYTLDSKTVNSSTSQQVITSDEDGLSSVTVNPYVLDSKTVNPSTNTIIVTSAVDGLSSVTVNAVNHAIDSNITAGNIREGVEILGVEGTYAGNNQSKTVDSSTVSQDVTPDNGYTGLSKVTVNPYTLQEKTINTSNWSYTNTRTVTCDSSYNGLSKVTIAAPPADENITVDSSTSSQTVTPGSGNLFIKSVTVNPYTVETASVNASTAEQVITPANADALSSVTVNAAPLQNRTVDASTVQLDVQRSSADYYGLRHVYVNAVTSSIDSNIQAGNIKDGVTILGVTGTYEGTVINNQSKTVDSSTVSQDVTPDNGYTGLEKVTVNPYVLDSKTVDSSTVSQTIVSNEDGLSSVTVNPYVLDSKTVDCSTVQQVITSDADGLSSVTVNAANLVGAAKNPSVNQITVTPPTGYFGLSSVTINAVTSSIDSNIQAGNIKSGVSILGVIGSYVGPDPDYDTIYNALIQI